MVSLRTRWIILIKLPRRIAPRNDYFPKPFTIVERWGIIWALRTQEIIKFILLLTIPLKEYVLLFLFIRLFSDPRIIQSTLPAINLSYLKLFVKLFWFFCRCSMIMSVVNWSVKMSVWRDGKETDLESKRAEAVKGHEWGGQKEGEGERSGWGSWNFREAEQ